MNKPFSEKLNRFVYDWWMANKLSFKYYDTPQFQLNNSKETFDSFKAEYILNKTVPMWNDGCTVNIFGSAEINAMFRSWHDFMHVITDNDFTLQGEIETYKVQVEMLPKEWEYERLLLQAEIIGQGIHYSFSDKTISDQRAFARNYIKAFQTV